MMIIPDITKDEKLNDLFNVQNWALHIQYLTENITQLRTYEALQMTRFYEPWFKQHPTFASLFPLTYQQLMELVVDNKWMAFNMLPQAETIELLHSHLLALFTLSRRYPFSWEYVELPEFTLGEQMRVNILRIGDLEARDYYKVQLSVALKTNQEIITTAPFFSAVKQVSPTLEMWFKEYLRAIGPQSDSSEFLLSEFLHKSEPGLKLDANERGRLELIFKLYHRLVRSSWMFEGREEKVTFESENQAGVLQYGEFIPYDKTTMQTILELTKTTTEQGTAPRPPVARIDIKPAGQALATGPDIAATTGPDHFTEQDEAEIKQHSAVVVQAKPDNYHQVIADIKQELALSFATPDQDKRFSELVTSVLRGLRDTMELKQYLVDLALPSADIAAIIAAVQQQLVPQKPKRSGPAPKLAGKPTLAQITKPVKEEPSDVGTDLSLQSMPNTVSAQSQPKPTFLPKLKRSRAQHRPMVDDVKLQPSMVMGPIDELRALDTVEFRRLSADPAQATARVHDRITLLAEESIAKEAEGINAFKLSPLNTLYLELGNESIASGKTVTDLITERETKGVPTLSVTEFNALADLNKQLRF